MIIKLLYLHYVKENKSKFFFNSKGTNRFLTVYKRERSTIVQADAVIKLQKASKQSISNLLQAFPINHKECQDLLPPIERERPPNTDGILISIYIQYICN